MSKELEALKEARNHRHEKDKNLVVIDIDYFNRCLDGIETALKDYEHLYQIWNCKDSDTMIIQTTKTIHDENNKKLKALEIIKEKPQIEITHIQWGKIKTYDEYLKRVYEWDIGYEDMMLTQEEFDLLREVLF